MALPAIVVAAGEASGKIAGGVAVAQTTVTLVEPWKRDVTYNINRLNPNVIPQFNDLLDQYYQGIATWDEVQAVSWRLGIDMRAPGSGTYASGWWRGVIMANRPVPDVSTVIRWRRKDIIDDDQFVSWMKRHGHKQADRQQAYLLESEPPDPGQILTLLNRNTIDTDRARTYLAWQGMPSATVQDHFLSLRFVIPGPSDQIMFSVREAWDEDVVQRFKYDEEFPEPFRYWSQRVGLGQTGQFTTADGVVHPNRDWATIYWRSHWQVVSPTQAYSMFQRLRPGRVARYADVLPNLRPFTLDDVRTVLRIADYPVPFRDQLAAVAFNLPRLIDIRNFVRYGIIDRAELVELFLDRGMSPVDARRLAELTIKQQRSATGKPIRRNARATLTASYLLGSIDADQLAQGLYTVLLEDPDDLQAYTALGPAQQVAVARADNRVQAAMAVIEFERLAANVKRWVALVRKKYITGGITRDEATRRLNDLGIVPAAVIRYVNEWAFEREVGEKHDTAAALVRWYKHGLMDVQEMNQRLVAIGYDETQIARIIADANRDIQIELGRVAEKNARNTSQRQRALEQQAKAQARERARLQKEMLALGTPVVLSRWLCAGLITVAEVQRRLLAMGRAESDIAKLIEEARRCAEKKGKSIDGQQKTNGLPATGEGGGTSGAP